MNTDVLTLELYGGTRSASPVTPGRRPQLMFNFDILSTIIDSVLFAANRVLKNGNNAGVNIHCLSVRITHCESLHMLQF